MESLIFVKIICIWCLLKHDQVYGQGYDLFNNSIIVTSLMTNIWTTRNVHVNIIPGTLYDIQPNASISISNFGLSQSSTNLRSIAIDYSRRLLYMYDANVGTIYVVTGFDWRSGFSNMPLEIVHNGVSHDHVRLAFDWVSNNIYWTDRMYSWIIVQSGRNSTSYKILIHDDLDKPFALAVDPLNRLLFWSDVGTTMKIERSTLSGQDRRAIISTGLLYPTNIDVDQNSARIVWVDAARDTLETANFDGTDRRNIKRLSHTEFYDVAVFRELVCVTDYSQGNLYIINQNSGAAITILQLNSREPFRAVEIYSSEVQPTRTDVCFSNGCSDLCFNEQSGPLCMCKEGYKLNQDGKTCSEDAGQFHRALVWSNTSSVCLMDIRVLTTVDHLNIIQCVVSDGFQIKHFDIDMADRKIIYADGSVIYSSAIGTASSKQRLVSSTSEVTGLAVDWRDKNVYWTTGGSSGSINLVSQETLQTFVLLNADLVSPRELYLHPLNNSMLWISGNLNSFKIEKAELDGSDRKTIVFSGSLTSPTSLTVDVLTNTIYFIDGQSVKQCDLEGGNMKTMTTTYTSPLYVLLYKNYLIVADRDYPFNYIETYEKTKATLLYQFSGLNVQLMTDMKVLDATSVQPQGLGPCNIYNGNCEQICIPIGRNKICRCEYGYTLDANRETCSSVSMLNNFLLVTDWTHNKIYQVSLVGDDVRALDTKTYGSPVGVVYNHATQTVYWNTEAIIHSLNIQTKAYRILYNTAQLGCHADRFAIDGTSGNIYFTALSTTTAGAGFVGVVVLSPDGLIKRLIRDGLRPRAIALDPEDGLLFWTDHGEQPSFLKRANMDGTNAQTILSTGLKWPNGLAIDTRANTLYLTDGFTNIIYRCTYQGACVQYYSDSEAQLMDIELIEDYLYYTAWNRVFVTKLHKTNTADVTRLAARAELGRLDSLSGYSSTYTVNSVSSACLPNNGRGPCSTFCLPTVAGYTCACEDGVALRSDQKTCENVNVPTTSSTVSTTTPTTTTTQTTTTTTPSTTTTTTTTPRTTTTTTASSTTTRTSPTTTTTTPSTTTTSTTTTRTTTSSTTSNTTPSTTTRTTTSTTTSNTTPSTTTSTTRSTTTTSRLSVTSSMTTSSTTTAKTTASTPTTISASINSSISITTNNYPEQTQPIAEKQLQQQLPVAAIAGGAGGFAVLIIIIIVLLIVIVKRSKRNAGHSAHRPSFDLTSIYSPHYESEPPSASEQRPESTYAKIGDLIDLSDTPYETLSRAEQSPSESPYNETSVSSDAYQTSPFSPVWNMSVPLHPERLSQGDRGTSDYLEPTSIHPADLTNPMYASTTQNNAAEMLFYDDSTASSFSC